MASASSTFPKPRKSPVFLRMAAHAEAFARAPLAYLRATFWRLRGYRLRARAQFARLLGATSRAYPLWIATREADRKAELAATVPPEAFRALILIDARGPAENLGSTFESIRALHPAGARCDVAVLVSTDGGDAPLAAPMDPEWHQLPECERDSFLRAHAEAAERAGRRLFVLQVPAGDLLASTALIAYAGAFAADRDATRFYADDDLIAARGHRHSPHFKPRWNAELVRHHDFLTGSTLVDARELVEVEVEAVAPGAAGRPDPVHVPHVLHHRRSRPDPVVPPAVFAEPAGGWPHVSVVVPTRNQADLLRTCLAGVEATSYPAMDVTVIDNGSDDPGTLALLDGLGARGMTLVRDPGPFNYAALHNRVFPDLAGPLVCLLNNDIEIIDPDWLKAMVVQAIRPDVGAVGARLLYPDRSVQHAGIVLGIGEAAGHAHRRETPGSAGYFARSRLPQFASAVTAACLLVEAAKLEAAGGFDEDRFPVAFNDVDLCLRLNLLGFQSFYEPRATLVHHESKSRGFDRRGAGKARLTGELAALKARWHTDTMTDPFHHPELSGSSERFVVRL